MTRSGADAALDVASIGGRFLAGSPVVVASPLLGGVLSERSGWMFLGARSSVVLTAVVLTAAATVVVAMLFVAGPPAGMALAGIVLGMTIPPWWTAEGLRGVASAG